MCNKVMHDLYIILYDTYKGHLKALANDKKYQILHIIIFNIGQSVNGLCKT